MVKVRWSTRANNTRISILKYGKEEFGLERANKLNDNIEKAVARLESFPRMGNIEPLLCDLDKEYRSWVVHKHYKIIYVIYEAQDEIYIVDLWDTRQEPDKLILFK